MVSDADFFKDEEEEEIDPEEELLRKRAQLSRQEYMKSLKIPENTEELVIIPSNEKGTGFMKNNYDERFLKDVISKELFDTIIENCNKINARKYTEKRLADTAGTQ
jgi:hypothetical protein